MTVKMRLHDAKDQCERHGEMSDEAKINGDGMELENSEGRGPERFDISGSPDKPVDETVELTSRAVAPTERRLITPEKGPCAEEEIDRYSRRVRAEATCHISRRCYGCR